MKLTFSLCQQEWVECDAPTSVDHVLSCKKGGLVIKRHNEVRDSLGDILGMGYNNVVKEPIVD